MAKGEASEVKARGRGEGGNGVGKKVIVVSQQLCPAFTAKPQASRGWAYWIVCRAWEERAGDGGVEDGGRAW